MSKLLNKGGYGCIYYPGIKCTGESTGDYLTKLVNVNNGKNEINISKMVKKIPNYIKYFSPIESWCTISSSKLSVPICSSVNTKNEYTILKKPYVHTVPVLLTIPFILTLYQELKQSIQILIRNKIVHFDIKKYNILFSPFPIIIDFGISFSIKKVLSNLPKCFYLYAPEEDNWPIDVHILSYIINVGKLTDESVRKTCTIFVKNHRIFKKQTAKYRKNYLDQCIQYYSTFIPMNDNILELIKGWKTWDMYGLATFIINLIQSKEPGHPFKDKMLDLLHYNPYKRI